MYRNQSTLRFILPPLCSLSFHRRAQTLLYKEERKKEMLDAQGNGHGFGSAGPVYQNDEKMPPITMTSTAVGTGPDEFYARTLPPWRAAIRRFAMRNLEWESQCIGRMQRAIRTPWLDSFFVNTSSLGTHTFFMIALPALFFFGYPKIGRGLVFILAMGVYCSSFIKDLFCSPRPYEPTVTRLTIGSHHLEYGFPSTHSTNSVSMALYVYSLVHQQYFESDAMSTLSYAITCICLAFYTFSIVFGRLYTGMHSFTDCAVGVTLGSSIWAAHHIWWAPVESWLAGASTSSPHPSWVGPLIIIVLCGMMVHWHPQPAEDCPCFEDAIAFVSVVAGVLLAHWASIRVNFDDASLVSRMAGTALPFLSSSPIAHPWDAAALWWATAILKLTSGIAIIFIWRLAVKFALHSLLPPLFRLLARRVVPLLVSLHILPQGTGLPKRRFYLPATEYDGAVPEENGLHPVPSVIDLSEVLQSRERKNYYIPDNELGDIKYRKSRGRRSTDLRVQVLKDTKSDLDQATSSQNEEKDDVTDDSVEGVKHYDADVLTKVIVYAGIGVISSGPIPIMFELLGWGIRP